MGETEALSLIPFELLPLGFRFHPTDEELINNYLKRKLNGRIKPREAAIMPEVDVCRFEPWDLPDKSPIRSLDPEWFFFAPVDRKYPSGNRSNRATEAGYWKATGKDRLIKSKIGGAPMAVLVGMKKTLVFHRGRAPRGTRTNWIMHEYRAVEPEFECSQGGFVLCRLFRKSEDTLPCSSSNEVQRTELSSPNMSSPGSMLSEADGLEEFPTPLNQATPNSDLLQGQELQSLPEKIDEERAGVVDEVKHLIPYPSKPEETQFTSNMPLAVGDHEAPTIREEGAPLFDDLAEFLGPEYQHLFSDEIPQKHMNPAILDYPSHDDMGMGLHAQLQHQMLEEDSLTELLDTMACTPEDHSAVSNYQADSATNIMPVNQFYAIDNELARDFKLQSGSSNDVDSEALLTKGGLGLQASSSGSLQPVTYNRNNESAVKFEAGESLQPVTYNRNNESAVNVCKFETGELRDLPVQHANDGSVRSLPNTAQSGFNMRKRQVFSVGFLAKQGAAERRIRLQSSVGAGGKCKVVGVMNEKGLMSMAAEEVGRDSKNNVDETVASDFGDNWSEAPESAEITEVVDDSSVVDDAVISSEKALPVNDPTSTLRLRVKLSTDADGNLEKVSSLHEVKPKTGIFSVHRVCVVLLVIMFLVFAGMWFFNIMGG